MRGLIYKEFTVFCKCTDKKLILIAAAFSLLLLCKAGYYGGLMASVLLAMTVGMQNVMSFVSDDKARWQKYQMALPMSDMSVVASKYISVLCTLGISLLGAGALNLASSVLYRNFDPVVWGLGAFAAADVDGGVSAADLLVRGAVRTGHGDAHRGSGILFHQILRGRLRVLSDGGFPLLLSLPGGGCDSRGFRGIPADQRGGICQAEGAAASIAVPPG